MRLIVLAVTVAFMFGCSHSQAPLLVLAPQVPVTKLSNLPHSKLQILVIDRRQANYVAISDDGDQVHDILTATTPPRIIFQNVLEKGFTQAGFQTEPYSENKLTFYLDELQANILQQTFDYQMDTVIEVSVKAENQQGFMTKRYRVTGNKQGPLTLSRSQLETELNRLIEQLTTDIMNDPQLMNYLQ